LYQNACFTLTLSLPSGFLPRYSLLPQFWQEIKSQKVDTARHFQALG